MLGGAALATGSGGLGTVSVLSYVALPAIVHGAIAEGGHAAASIGLRLMLPVTGALIGYVLGHHQDEACPRQTSQTGHPSYGFCLNLNFSGYLEGFIGAVLGAFTASMIDVFGLAYTRDRVPNVAFGAQPVPGGSLFLLGAAL